MAVGGFYPTYQGVLMGWFLATILVVIYGFFEALFKGKK